MRPISSTAAASWCKADLSHLHVGDFRITHIRAGSYWWDGGAMFGVVPKTLWSKTQPVDDLNRIEAAFNCFIVENGTTRVLVETGGGVRHDERARERMRMPDPPVLHELLAEQGFDPDSFDYVINTHLHWDHAGGNTIGDFDNGNWRKVRPAFSEAICSRLEPRMSTWSSSMFVTRSQPCASTSGSGSQARRPPAATVQVSVWRAGRSAA